MIRLIRNIILVSLTYIITMIIYSIVEESVHIIVYLTGLLFYSFILIYLPLRYVTNKIFRLDK